MMAYSSRGPSLDETIYKGIVGPVLCPVLPTIIETKTMYLYAVHQDSRRIVCGNGIREMYAWVLEIDCVNIRNH